jgi:hypothetical protein
VNRLREGTVVVAEETAFTAGVGPPAPPRLSAEHAEFAWLTPEQARERLVFAGLRRAVRLATTP